MRKGAVLHTKHAWTGKTDPATQPGNPTTPATACHRTQPQASTQLSPCVQEDPLVLPAVPLRRRAELRAGRQLRLAARVERHKPTLHHQACGGRVRSVRSSRHTSEARCDLTVTLLGAQRELSGAGRRDGAARLPAARSQCSARDSSAPPSHGCTRRGEARHCASGSSSAMLLGRLGKGLCV